MDDLEWSDSRRDDCVLDAFTTQYDIAGWHNLSFKPQWATLNGQLVGGTIVDINNVVLF